MKWWLPSWAWRFVFLHFRSTHARPALKWMNRFAFVGVTLGIFAWISVVSVMSGLQNDIRDRILNEKAHLLWEGVPQSALDSRESALREALGAELESVRFLFQTEGLLELPSTKHRARIAGAGVVIQGRPELDDGVYLGSELAAQFNLGAGDEIKLRSAWRIENPPFESQVSGVFETGVYEIDRSTVRVGRAALEKWLLMKDSVSRIEVRVKHPLQVDQFKEKVETALGLPVITWKQSDAALWYSLRLEKIVMTSAIFFIVLLAAISIHLALSVRVTEKSREIALLRALGADDRLLQRLYLSEGLVLGLGGALTGLLLSYIFCMALKGYFVLPSFYYLQNLPVSWDWGANLLMVTITVALALLASLSPARRVTRLPIQEALRS